MPLQRADSKGSPPGSRPSVPLSGESSHQGAVFSPREQPPLLGNIRLKRGAQTTPESSFPKPSLLQSSELLPQVRTVDARQPLPTSRPSLLSVRTNVDPHGILWMLCPVFQLSGQCVLQWPWYCCLPRQGPFIGVPA